MTLLSKTGRRAIQIALLLVMVSFPLSLPAHAQGGIALSGSFYRQEFEIPQGSSVHAPSVYVVVFNNGDNEIQAKMNAEAPLGVNLSFSSNDFALKAGEQKKVLIGVEVTQDAAPGEYEISVIVEPYRSAGGGIQIMGAAGQSASLTILGDAARVIAQIASPDGGPVPGVIRLFNTSGEEDHEVAYSETGMLEATVAPGSYTVAGYVAEEKLAEESFEVAGNEEKRVTLTVKTIYLAGFGVVPSYHEGTEEIAFAQVVYTLKNLYKPVEKAEVILQPSFDSAPLNEILLATLSPLEIGQIGLNYNYIPAEGWRNGEYGFKLELRLDGQTYTVTSEQKLSVAGKEETSAGGNTALIGALVAAVIAVLGGVIFFLARKRKG